MRGLPAASPGVIPLSRGLEARTDCVRYRSAPNPSVNGYEPHSQSMSTRRKIKVLLVEDRVGGRRNDRCARCACAACRSSAAASIPRPEFEEALPMFAPDLILSDYTPAGLRRHRGAAHRAAAAARHALHIRLGDHRRGARHRGAEAGRRRLRAQGESRAARAGDGARPARGAGAGIQALGDQRNSRKARSGSASPCITPRSAWPWSIRTAAGSA